MLGVLFGISAYAIDGWYLGGELGYVDLKGRGSVYSDALGVSAVVGVRANSILDVVARVGYSSHSGAGGLTLIHPTMSGDFHLFQMNDLDFTVGLGPGIYLFTRGATTETNFGLNIGIGGDVVLDESIHLGIGLRWHEIFGGTIGDNFWSIGMRVGVFFESL